MRLDLYFDAVFAISYQTERGKYNIQCRVPWDVTQDDHYLIFKIVFYLYFNRDRDRHYTGAHQLDYDTYMTSTGGLPPSKQMYFCLVPTCKEQIRGDKLRDHYKKYVKFGLLDGSMRKQDRKLQLLSAKVS